MYQLVEMLLDNKAAGRPGHRINPKGLVVHWTANTAETADADNNRNYFNFSGLAVSAHYIVDDKKVVQCLPEDEMAYHVGANRYMAKAQKELSWYPNNCTLGVEICVNSRGNFKKTIENAAALCADICRRHGWTSKQLWRHYDVTGKDCPKFFVVDDTAKAYGFSSAANGWAEFKAKVDLAIKGKPETLPKWKQEIMEKAKTQGLISSEHNPDDPAPKWFVLQVVLNTMERIQG